MSSVETSSFHHVGNGHDKSRRIKRTGEREVETIDKKKLTYKIDFDSSLVASSSKKRKRSSPFRIKTGCVVALRYRAGGNQVSITGEPFQSSDEYVDVWTDPLPGRDEGLALIGKRVRCCFVVKSEQHPNNYMIEGEVVSIIDYDLQWERMRQKRRRREPVGIAVELLVDLEKMQAIPFLKRTDEVIDVSKLSDAAKRSYKNEEIIKGKNKAMVTVVLAYELGLCANDASSDQMLIAKWVIRKRVVAKPQTKKKTQIATKTAASSDGKLSNRDRKYNPTAVMNEDLNPAHNVSGKIVDATKPPPKRRRKNDSQKRTLGGNAIRYIGDKDDNNEQQAKNWRWVAGRQFDYSLLFDRSSAVDDFSNGFLGEVLKVEPVSKNCQAQTLAMVFLRRLILPEHTASGRLWHHGPFDAFDDLDSFKVSRNNSGSNESNYLGESYTTYQIPIEELIIVGRQIHRKLHSELTKHNAQKQLKISLGYSLLKDCFVNNGLTGNFAGRGFNVCSSTTPKRAYDARGNGICHRCRMFMPVSNLKRCSSSACIMARLSDVKKNDFATWWCSSCLRVLQSLVGSQESHYELEMPCCSGLCDCRECRLIIKSKVGNKIFCDAITAAEMHTYGNNHLLKSESDVSDIQAFGDTISLLRYMQPVAFAIPYGFAGMHHLPLPTAKPMTQSKFRPVKKGRKNKHSNDRKNGRVTYVKSKGKGKNSKFVSRENNLAKSDTSPQLNDETLPKGICSRMLPYSKSNGFWDGSSYLLVCSKPPSSANDKPRNLRESCNDSSGETVKDDKSNSSRAARANQRRLMKDVAAIGATNLGFDALVGREQQLRFDRSSIHAWGVFADESISAGDMVVEYRGEIIGNAMAEKREIQYERAKIGSDYMFRVDNFTVCDATKQGNVARFINHSCEPNCYTKIISVDGIKRIVVYAKKNIPAGEELCYDYKFQLEYDESKRIPCRCGARECHGYMNWNKRYVTLLPTADEKSGFSTNKVAISQSRK